MKLWQRELDRYPAPYARRLQLGLVVLITVALYYALYVQGGVIPLIMRDLHMSFTYLVGMLALSNALGAFASLLAGLSDRFGRANLVVYGLLLVALLIVFAVPAVHDRQSFALLQNVIGFIEGIILVATPALIRDFSPQVGRATAMGFWTIGPVLGSLLVSAVNSATLPTHPNWRTQFVYCGAFCAVVWMGAFLLLRELPASLRDQIMVNEQDRAFNEGKALKDSGPAATRNGWLQMLRPDIIGSALGVSLLLLIYYTTVAFGVIYLVTVFHFTPARANALLNWNWAANAVALIAAGLWSDALKVRKPFMLVGGLGASILIALFMGSAPPAGGAAPSFTSMALIGSGIAVLMGGAYATWMASFTETIEARNPALTATGLAVWGWLLRLVVTGSFLALPHVVDTVTPLVEAPETIAAVQALHGRDMPVPPDLAARMAEIAHAAAATAAQWRSWFTFCAYGVLIFLAFIFTMKGRWSPAKARADEAEHDAAVRLALRGAASQ